jgi:hypothetical protein
MTHFTYRIIFLLLMSTGLMNTLYGQNQHSVIIALSDYWGYGHYWNDINSKNDAVILKSALLANGFKESNIHVVTNAETKSDIFKALDKYILQSAKSGDFVHIHYSGHGQQVADLNGDEVDGYDEALVPLSAPSRPKYKDKNDKEYSYDGNQHLLDDELGGYLSKVRELLGPNGELLVTIDACHSGTGTRGLSVARGNSIKIEPEGFEPLEVLDREESWLDSDQELNPMAEMVTFYASSSQELNYEFRADDGLNYGPLSYALASAVSQGRLKGSFEELFYRVKQKMAEIAPNQSPFADGLKTYKLGGDSTVAIHWITDWNSNVEFELGSGFLMGVTEGSLVEGISSSGKRWIGRIRQADPTKSLGEITQKSPVDYESTAFVKLIVPSFDKSATVCFDIDRKDDLETLQSSLNQFEVDNVNCRFQVALKNNRLSVVNNQDVELINTTPKRDNDGQLLGASIDELRQLLSKAATNEMLKEVSLNEPSLNAVLDYYLLEQKNGLTSPSQPEDFKSRERIVSSKHVLEVSESSYLELRITNKCSTPFYYALIDIMPDGNANFLVPRVGRSADEYYLEPGQSNKRRNQFFKIGPPYGYETMKLIISDKPIDWNGLYSTRGEANDQTEFEKAIQEMMNGVSGNRDLDEGIDPRVDISTYQYKIVKKTE